VPSISPIPTGTGVIDTSTVSTYKYIGGNSEYFGNVISAAIYRGFNDEQKKSWAPVPSVQTGGLITGEGLAYLHLGEFVKAADVDRTASNSGGNIYNTFNATFNGAKSDSMTSSGFDRNTEYKLQKWVDSYMAQSLRHRLAQ
jgi:hypothetical protein